MKAVSRKGANGTKYFLSGFAFLAPLREKSFIDLRIDLDT
jgi:hypothetical protein